MPKDLVRYHQTGNDHFITFSCYHRQSHLGTPAARNTFQHCLELIRQRYSLTISAYVVMPEHVHLLLSEPPAAPLATAIQALKLAVTVRHSQRPFWQKRYFDFNIRSEAKLIEKRRYIHRNPVTRGLTTEPDLWPWSSFCHWATGEPGPVKINSPWTARGQNPIHPPNPGVPHISPLRCGSAGRQAHPHHQTQGAPHLASEMWVRRKASPSKASTNPGVPHISPLRCGSAGRQAHPIHQPEGAPHLASEMWVRRKAKPIPTTNPGVPHNRRPRENVQECPPDGQAHPHHQTPGVPHISP